MKLCAKALAIRAARSNAVAMRTDRSYRLELARALERHMRQCGMCSR